MKSANQNRTTAAPFINVTPLIDVLLVLLIIFMIISPTRPSKFDAQLPEKREPGDSERESLALVVTINHGGVFSLNSQPANTLDELRSLLYRALDGRPTDIKAVFLKAPRALNYGEVVKVIDVMKMAGCAPIALQIENLDQ
ncbi:MAG TPA: biopolymer transporter ExbD [Blastocatellia bacterium]|nr:biopolymer transporter ExbD [Blastocatellia bacterium]